MKRTAFMMALLLLALPLVAANGNHDFSTALEIIEQQVRCDQLNEEQFELLGDYYMELMHPGEVHILMDKRMGGEGSESLKLMHVRTGERFYCGDSYGMGRHGVWDRMRWHDWRHDGAKPGDDGRLWVVTVGRALHHHLDRSGCGCLPGCGTALQKADGCGSELGPLESCSFSSSLASLQVRPQPVGQPFHIMDIPRVPLSMGRNCPFSISQNSSCICLISRE